MASLTGQSIKDTYQSLLKTGDNGLVTSTFKGITDGSGSATGLYLKDEGVLVSGSLVMSGSINITENIVLPVNNILLTGSQISFTKTAYSSSQIDIIASGITEIARGNQNGIYNTASEASFNPDTSPSGTLWNSIYVDPINYGWSNLQNIPYRTYDTWTNAVDYNAGKNILDLPMVMHDTNTNKYYLIKFSQWTPGANGGGFAYTRQEVNTTTSTIFTRPSASASTVDTISAGVIIKRNNNENGIYNAVLESSYTNAYAYQSPLNTKWNSVYTDGVNNGWNNLSNVKGRVYSSWYDAVNFDITSSIGLELVMHDQTTDLYHMIKFTNWSSSAAGAGFEYERTLIQNTDAAIVFPDGTIQSTAASPSIRTIGTTLYSTNPPAGSGINKEQSIFLGTQAGYTASEANNSNFLGYQAGYQATNGRRSNFLGELAGYSGSNAFDSNFLGYRAGYLSSNANNSNFLGNDAGYNATTAFASNFLGQSAGYQATVAGYSNFLGQSAGYQAISASDSNFLGSGAGYQATNALNSNFLGSSAGRVATNARNSNFIGSGAGFIATNAILSNFIGSSAGTVATNASASNFIGQSAGSGATNAHNSNFIGKSAGEGSINASYSTFIGFQAGFLGFSTSTGRNNIIIGTNISLPAGRQDSINLGAIIFATGSYFNTDVYPVSPFTSTVGNGRVGINVVNPRYNLDVSGSGNYTNGLTVTGSLTVTSTITAQTLVVQTITSSTDFITGSTRFGSLLSNTHEFTGSVSITGSLTSPNITGSLQGTASWADNAISSSYPIAVTGSTLYSVSPLAGPRISTNNSIFFGAEAGSGSVSSNYSNFIGYQTGVSASNTNESNFIGVSAGYNARNSYGANFIGNQAGNLASGSYKSNFIGRSAGAAAYSSYQSNFIGESAGEVATNAYFSNFIGYYAGYQATSSYNSNFVGYLAGESAYDSNNSTFIGPYAGRFANSAYSSVFLGSGAGAAANRSYRANFIGDTAGESATDAYQSNMIGYFAGYNSRQSSVSNFIGYNAGAGTVSASYSILIGHRVGYNSTFGLGGIKSNNIIMGNNITLPDNTKDSINLGAIIFATGSYSTVSGAPFAGTVGNGRVGINVVNPVFNLDVSGSGRYTSGLIVTGSVTATQGFTGSLFGTASWAVNAISSSYPIAVTGSSLYSISPAAGIPDPILANDCIFLGDLAGSDATNAFDSNFIGRNAGYQATNSDNSNFIGYQVGYQATNAYWSNFIGISPGYQATNAYYSNFIGVSAGQNATNANNSNFLGNQAGRQATSASYSTLIGYNVGNNVAGGALGIKSNNIIIGTNITLPNGTQNSINLGAIIFATGSYSTTTGNPFSGSIGNGRVGINVVNPTQALDVSGSVQISQVLVLPPQNPLPSGQPTGSFAVSGSGVDCKPYFWNGSTWTALF